VIGALADGGGANSNTSTTGGGSVNNRRSRQQQRQLRQQQQEQEQAQAQQRKQQQQVQHQDQFQQQQQQQQQQLPPGAAAAALLSRGAAADLGAAAFRPGLGGAGAGEVAAPVDAIDDAAAFESDASAAAAAAGAGAGVAAASAAPDAAREVGSVAAAPAQAAQAAPTSPAPSSSPLPPADPALAALPAHERAVVALFEANTPSVVHVAHLPRATQASGFSALDERRLPLGQGTGLVWDRAGHVVTNLHVVRGASEVKVTLSDRSTHTARVVGCDAAKDVAVLRLAALPRHRAEALRPAALGCSGALRVGQSVYAIGNR